MTTNKLQRNFFFEIEYKRSLATRNTEQHFAYTLFNFGLHKNVVQLQVNFETGKEHSKQPIWNSTDTTTTIRKEDLVTIFFLGSMWPEMKSQYKISRNRNSRSAVPGLGRQASISIICDNDQNSVRGKQEWNWMQPWLGNTGPSSEINESTLFSAMWRNSNCPSLQSFELERLILDFFT